MGRSHHNDIALPRVEGQISQLSRRHCKIELNPTNNIPYLIDLGSAHGTFLNGRKITKEALRPGDVIGIGDFQFEFEGELLFECDCL